MKKFFLTLIDSMYKNKKELLKLYLFDSVAVFTSVILFILVFLVLSYVADIFNLNHMRDFICRFQKPYFYILFMYFFIANVIVFITNIKLFYLIHKEAFSQIEENNA